MWREQRPLCSPAISICIIIISAANHVKILTWSLFILSVGMGHPWNQPPSRLIWRLHGDSGGVDLATMGLSTESTHWVDLVVEVLMAHWFIIIMALLLLSIIIIILSNSLVLLEYLIVTFYIILVWCQVLGWSTYSCLLSRQLGLIAIAWCLGAVVRALWIWSRNRPLSIVLRHFIIILNF